MMGTTWGRRGQRGQHVETTWGPSVGYGDDGDDVGTTGTMQG